MKRAVVGDTTMKQDDGTKLRNIWAYTELRGEWGYTMLIKATPHWQDNQLPTALCKQEEVKEMTVGEIEAKLGHKVKVVK